MEKFIYQLVQGLHFRLINFHLLWETAPTKELPARGSASETTEITARKDVAHQMAAQNNSRHKTKHDNDIDALLLQPTLNHIYLP